MIVGRSQLAFLEVKPILRTTHVDMSSRRSAHAGSIPAASITENGKQRSEVGNGFWPLLFLGEIEGADPPILLLDDIEFLIADAVFPRTYAATSSRYRLASERLTSP